MSTELEPPAQPARRISWRRWLVFIGLVLLLLLVLAGWWFIRSDRFNRYITREIEEAVKEYGLRAEVGGFDLGRGWRTATLRDVKLYNLQTGQPIATLDRAALAANIRQPFALRLSREIEFQSLDLEGLRLFVEIDEQGRSNLDGLRLPPPRASRRLTFDYSSLTGALTGGAFRLDDRQRRIQAELNDLNGEARPAGASQIRLQLSAGAGRAKYEDRETAIDGIDFIGRVTESSAEIETIALRSAMAEAKASGRIDDLRAPRYEFNAEARVKLDEASRLFAPDTALAGEADFKGRITGEGERYQLAGDLSSNEVRATGVTIRGARAEQVELNEQLNFSLRQARARSIVTGATGEAQVNDASISSLSGEVRDGRAHLKAARATVDQLRAGTATASAITLRDLTAELGEETSVVRGDLNLKSGTFGKVTIGETRGAFAADKNEVSLQDFTASLLGGSATGDLTMKTSATNTSRLSAEFSGLRTGDVFFIAAVDRPPLAGTVTGKADVTWPGTNARALSGDIAARFSGETTETAEAIPLMGEVTARAQRGVFNFDNLTLRTDASTLTARGSLALDGDSNLRYSVSTSRAEELQTIFTSFDVAREAIATYKPQLRGDFSATGTISGPLRDPAIAGDLNVSNLVLRDELLGSVSGRLLVSPAEIRFEEGRLTAANGGTVQFRGARYEITAGTLDLPGGFGAQPELNLLTEGDVSGYRVYVGFTGPLNDLEVTLRSEPDLARAEILSLITTGSTETGALSSDDLVRSGLGTAASLLSREFISRPVGREAERLFGLSRFQIDPVLRPNANPAARLTHTNLFGNLISGSLRLRGSRREQLGQLQFTDMRPFGKAWPTTVSAFFTRNADLRPFVRRQLVDDQVEENTAGRSFGVSRFATFIQTERRFSEQTSLRLRYYFENAHLFNLDNIPELEVTRNERNVRLGIVSAGISRDTRDSALNPTAGELFSADHSLAAQVFGGNESFNKSYFSYQRYETLPENLPLLGNSVVAVSARLGLAALFRDADRDGNGIILESERRLPISERFFSGGATTLRGFRFEEAGPQGILEPRNANELPTLVPIGGDGLAIFNFELRYPLTRNLRMVPFYNLGNVFRRVRDFSFSGMTNAVGLGFRFNTPLGPVGVDYGYLLDPPAFVTASGGVIRQRRGVFHIRIGQTF